MNGRHVPAAGGYRELGGGWHSETVGRYVRKRNNNNNRKGGETGVVFWSKVYLSI